MRNNSDSARPSAKSLVLTVRGDSPQRRSPGDGYANSNIENVPEPVFYVSSVHSESALMAEIEALKSQLKVAKNSNLEAKVAIEGYKTDLKDKIMVVKDLTSQIDRLKNEVKDQASIIEEGKRLVNGRDEHLTRFYDQKMVAFRAQVAELEEKLKNHKVHDLEVAKLREIELELKQRLEQALQDVKVKERQMMAIKEENQKRLDQVNEHTIEKADATTFTSPSVSEEYGGNMGAQMDMMNFMGMVPSSVMMPYAYSMASMMMANMEMSRLMSVSPWGISPMMQQQPFQASASVFGNAPQNQFSHANPTTDQLKNINTPVVQMQNWQTPVNHGVGSNQMSQTPQAPEIEKDLVSEIAVERDPISNFCDGQNESMELLTPKTVGTNSKKRNYEEMKKCDYVEKKANDRKENTKRSNDVILKEKLDGKLLPQTPVSDAKQRNSNESRDPPSTPTGLKWVSDGKAGFKSVVCSPDGSTHSAYPGESRTLDISSSRELVEKANNRPSKEDAELDSLIKKRHIHPHDDVLFKAFAKCSVLLPRQLRPRILVDKGVLALLVNHTSDRSFPYKIVVTEPDRGSRLMNVAMYDNVQIFQQGSEVIVKILHRRKGAPDSSAARSSKYMLEMRSEHDARLFYDTIFPSKVDSKQKI